METIWIRPERADDAPKFAEWVLQTKDNYFDPDIMQYPSTKVLVSHNSKALVYMPIQTAFFMESLSINPEATPHEVSISLKEAFINLQYQAQVAGVGEIYFVGTNEQTNKFAEKHGFELIPFPVYRLKVGKLGNESNNKSSNGSGR